MYTAIMLKCCLLSYRKCKQSGREKEGKHWNNKVKKLIPARMIRRSGQVARFILQRGKTKLPFSMKIGPVFKQTKASTHMHWLLCTVVDVD